MSDNIHSTHQSNRADIEIGGKTWNEITEQFSRELAETAPHKNLGDKTPRFTEPHGSYLYARLSAVHSHCIEWDNLSTVWLSLTADEKGESGNWVHPLSHDDGFRSDVVRQALYRARRKLDIERWAGIWLMAPRKTGYSHKHYALWLNCPQSVEQIESAFEPVIESHVRAHPTATVKGNPCSQAVQVRKDGNCERLLPEIGHNIPEIGSETDIRSLSEEWQYARIWAALYWSNDRIRQYDLGQFQQIANDARVEDMPDSEWQYGKGWQE